QVRLIMPEVRAGKPRSACQRLENPAGAGRRPFTGIHSMIRCKCPECDFHYEIADELAGKSVLCPECLTRFKPKGTSKAAVSKAYQQQSEALPQEALTYKRARSRLLVIVLLIIGAPVALFITCGV